MSFILGINAYHGDSAACLIHDGRLVAAAEEERFRRIKHWAGFPTRAIQYCLREASIGLREVEHIAINRDPKANLLRKIGYTLARRPAPRLVLDRMRNQRDWSSVEDTLEESFPGEAFHGQICHVEHHRSHLASAFLVSPYEQAVVLSVDGFGDFASASWGIGRGSTIEIKGRVYFPHSLGVFYEALTQYLGFANYGDEYKLMGLAAYGEPEFLSDMRRIVLLQEDGSFRLNLDFFRHHKERVGYVWKDCAPSVGTLYTPELEKLLGPSRTNGKPLSERDKNVAHSVQAVYEEAFFHLLNRLHQRFGLDQLALAGGCAMNSVANGKIYAMTPFRRVYIQAAAGDAGGAIGAAFATWHRLSGRDRAFVMDHAYWGPEFSNVELEEVLRARKAQLEAQNCRIERIAQEDQLCRRAAEAIAAGEVVGWFQGRMEWGPRALGNRSILCDPRRAGMKEILNAKIKRRESFRPFAPSVLRETVPDWFETDDDVRFMMKVFRIRPEKRTQIPAVTHVDGSGRLHTVRSETNSLYYRLIRTFFQMTGVPMLLNTSFNENEPVVCQPEEALDCFLRTKMDLLAMGPYVVERARGL